MHEQDKKQVDELAREREILNKNLLKAAAATTQQLDAVRLHEQNKKNLEQEVSFKPICTAIRPSSKIWKVILHRNKANLKKWFQPQ